MMTTKQVALPSRFGLRGYFQHQQERIITKGFSLHRGGRMPQGQAVFFVQQPALGLEGPG